MVGCGGYLVFVGLVSIYRTDLFGFIETARCVFWMVERGDNVVIECKIVVLSYQIAEGECRRGRDERG